MSSSTPRQEQLLDHALLLVREAGLAGLTVRGLAERVGFSEAALYRHYPSKAALVLALMKRLRDERLLGPIREIAGRTDRPAGQRLLEILRHHIGTILDLDGLPFLILSEAALAGDEDLLAVFRSALEELVETLASLIDEHRREEGLEDDLPARSLAPLLLALPAGAAILHRVRPDLAFENEVREHLAERYLERLLAPEEIPS